MTDWKWGDDEITQEITRRTGYKLEITNATTTGHQELSTQLSAESSLTTSS